MARLGLCAVEGYDGRVACADLGRWLYLEWLCREWVARVRDAVEVFERYGAELGYGSHGRGRGI